VRFVPLASGSQGNSTLVEFADTRLLVDAGLTLKELTRRLKLVNCEPESIDAILLSHEHIDHVRGAHRFSKSYDVPVVAPWKTIEAMDRSPQAFAGWVELKVHGSVELGPVTVHCFPVPHDAASPVGFVLEADDRRIGVATDVGHATLDVVEGLSGCDLVMLESNHDALLLRDGPYPWKLKQRVLGQLGHLSNAEAASVLKNSLDGRCQTVVLAHLSEKNNTPELARTSAQRAVQAAGYSNVEVRVARFDAPLPAMHL